MITKVLIDCVAKGNKKIYFFAQQINVLGEIDLGSGCASFLGSIPEENFFESYLVGGLVYKDSRLYLVPHNAKNMWMFDIKNKSWCICKIDFINPELRQKFSYVTIYDKKILMVGFKYPGIVSFDTDNNSVEYYDDVFFKSVGETRGEGYVRRNCFIDDGYLYAPCMFTNRIFKIDLRSHECCNLKVGDIDVGFAGICRYGDSFFLVSRHGERLIEWCEYSGGCKYYQLNGNNFSLGVFNREHGLIIPGTLVANTLYVDANKNIDVKDRGFSLFEVMREYSFAQSGNGTFHVYKDSRLELSSKVELDFDLKREFNEQEDFFVVENNIIDLKTFLAVL